jgi:beta-N-acetylhexosaminidase
VVTLLDPQFSDEDLDHVAASTANCAVVVVAAFVNIAEYRGNTSLPGGFTRLLNNLMESGKPVILGALGNPYLLRSFPAVKGYLAMFSSTPISEFSMVKALYGETAIQGHTPVTIPGFANYGDGIQLAAK